MKTLENLKKENPSGLLKIRESLAYNEYADNYGFELRSGCEIFKSGILCNDKKDKYEFPRASGDSLETLFTVSTEPGENTVVFVVESLKNGKVHCNLVLDDSAFQAMLADKNNQRVIKVTQFYFRIFQKQLLVPVC